ncbi:endonuclease/exonuclease/phosphatase family protein [Sediminitomix flava]|uniref:Endonuclease/Exonuclease/phosphatase family protein n=1 Tax=Sediminitomix flava TaxID=379075 RepID=A0A315ZDL9_SEDFL|nr:endonuclease [Sediminitomix flava]PWJ43229.1 Endonuclease/Exonuclease/phosphatase family protein [Sediminitomix flava]
MDFNKLKLFVSLCLIGITLNGYSQNHKATYDIHNIAFYNVENLFDTENDPEKNDEDFLPEGSYAWTEKRYNQKLIQLAEIISKLGAEKTNQPPTVVGIAEVENLKCLQDLIKTAPLSDYPYEAILVEGPDKRGVDTGLLYRKDLFDLKKYHAKELWIENAYKGFATRNQLVVEGKLEGEEIAFLVNHWPSRRAKSHYREEAGKLQRSIIDSLRQVNPNMHIVTMGDFNDDPTNKSMEKALGAVGSKNELNDKNYLYNPMHKMYKKGLGTLAYRDNWNLFDQIIISKEMIENEEGLRFYKAEICNFEELKNQNGRYKGYPFRTYAGGGYAGGYSDHFPVVIYLVKKQESTSL